MPERSADPGLGVAVVLAGVLGAVHLVLGSLALLNGPASPAAVTRSLAQATLGALLLPTAVGLARTAPWGRWLGVVCFGGIAVVQLLPLLAGARMAVPLLGIGLAGGAAVYLLVAGEAFERTEEARPIDEDTDPHRFVR